MPGIEQRVNPPLIERVTPCRPHERILSTTSDTMPSLPDTHLALSEAVTSDWQQRQAKEGKNFNNRLYHVANTLSRPVRKSEYVKSKTIVDDRNRDTVNSVLDGCGEFICVVLRNVIADLQKAMMKPLNGPWTSRIEWSVSCFTGIGGQIGER
ncbi:MAG: hypothetical protein F4Z02_08365 [Acidimicrobiia bacterium]|nr:hypothetical protein [Acidimicrobiia bacterium]MYG71096.1 hypothetical protein [Acidimicrobiia bacterium]